MIIKRHVITCYISRNIPFSIKSIENILFDEHENLDCLLNDIETDEGYEATIIVEVNMFVRLHHFNYYEDDEFSTFTFNFRSDDVVDHITIDNIADVMRAAHREIYSCMDDESLVQLAQMHGVNLERVGFSTARWLALTMSGLKPRSTGR